MNVISRALADSKFQGFEYFLGKAGGDRGDLIVAGLQSRQAIRAVRPGLDHLGDAGACVSGCDCGPGDHCAGLIHYGPTQGCGGVIHLAEESWSYENSKYKQDENEVSGRHWGNLLEARMGRHEPS